VALHAALLGLDIGPGDEVIVPSLTFISTVSTVIMTGARPIFADIGGDDFNIDPSDCARRVTERTRAVIPVHYGGRPCDMDALREVVAEKGIALVEDSAEALGASYRGRMAGTLGNAAMFSFTPGKVVTTGEGGIVTTADADLAACLRLLRNHGMTAPYQHEIIGYNYRMIELQAAVGLEQLLRVEEVINARREKAKLYSERLKDVPGLKTPDPGQDIRHSFSLYTIIVDRFRDDLAAFLAEKNVETKVYFPPVHRQKALKPHVDPGLILPNTEHLADCILSLPIYPSLSVREIDYITDLIKLFVHKRS
jgi:perosamine synthetase